MATVARRVGWTGLAVGISALGVGLVMAVASAVAAGDWYLAQQPWIGLGLALIVAGLAATAIFGSALDVVEPIGRLRWLAVVPVLFVAAAWTLLLVFGVAGHGGAEHDIATILYSLPGWLVAMVVATLAIALPLALARFRQAA